MALFGSGLWGVVVIVGPILLAAAVIWAIFNNRQSRAGERRTEAATNKLYKEQDAEDKANGDQ